MYAELDLKFKQPILPADASANVKQVIGLNQIDVVVALSETLLASVSGIVRSALAAEQVLGATTVIYFMEGNDTIKVHIVTSSLAEMRRQCVRITRQLSGKIRLLSTANASILVSMKGSGEVLIVGVRLSYALRLWAIAVEKFIGKFFPAAIAFALAAMFLSGTTAVASAAIGAVAAGVGALVEAAIAAGHAGEWTWTWKDLS